MALTEMPVGRLEWILEYRMSMETRAMLLGFFARLPTLTEPTFVAGLGAPCTNYGAVKPAFLWLPSQ